ncbi:cytosine permease [Streptomyces sp. NPDC012438]|uniref:cytosine permease n=1 Tax=Streptomyces sp. NPDC012438 TaxID=3364833 RepID=UPI0036E5D499
MTATTPAGRPAIADDRVELAPGTVPADPRFVNDDLLPVPVERRRWTTYDFTALWVGMAHTIPSWMLASGLVALGMDWKRAVLAFAVGGILSVGGSHSAPGAGPFPEDGLIPFLEPLADYGWAVGLAASLLLYTALMRRGTAARSPARSS